MTANRPIPNLIVYHANCQDGLTAMSIAHHAVKCQERDLLAKKAGELTVKTKIPTPKSLAGVYQISPNISDFKDKNVLIVDFSYPLTILEKILDVAHSVVILDHHVSAYQELIDFTHKKLTYIYDVTKCGAMLTWEYFFPNELPPPFLQCVNDRDLWLHKMPESEYFYLSLKANDYTETEFLDYILALINEYYFAGDSSFYKNAIAQGKAYKQYQDSLVKQIAKKAHEVTLNDGTKAMQCNAPMALASEIGDYLAKQNGVAWIYEVYADHIKHSLRVSPDCSFNASAYAKEQGGGGHEKASGWKEPMPFAKPSVF